MRKHLPQESTNGILRTAPQRRLRELLVVLIALGVGGLALSLQTQAPQSLSLRQAGTSAEVGTRAREAARLNNLGVAYMNQQRLEQAWKLFQQAFARHPGLRSARLNEGIALLNLQRYEAAREILLEVLQREPSNVRAWFNLGLLHKTLGQPEPALAAFGRVAELDPRDADTHYFLGLLYSQLGKYQSAVLSFERALTLAPFHASAEFGLARAYQRIGDSPRARQHLERFQHLTQKNLGVPMGLAYGEQGFYSLADQVIPEAGAVPAPLRVRFVSATKQAGLDFEHAGTLPPEVSAAPGAASAPTLGAFFGSGACFLDYDGDGRLDLFLLNSGKEAASALYQNGGKGRFREVTRAAGLEVRGYGLGCTVGDYDNDGWTDLAVGLVGRVLLFRNLGNGRFADATQTAGLLTEGLPLGLSFLDYDHDGDLDLFVPRFRDFPWQEPNEPFDFPFEGAPANVLWRNNGNGTFTDWTQPAGLVGPGPSVAALATDFNNDRAVDLLLTGWHKNPVVFLNPREGSFVSLEPWSSAVPAPAAGAVAFDFDKDGWMDLAFTHWRSPGLSLWRNREGRQAERVSLPEFRWKRGWGLAALDYDNDGWLDLAAVGEGESHAEVRLLRNHVPSFLGWELLALSVIGAVLIPAPGFVLLMAIAFYILLVARRSPLPAEPVR